MFWERVVMVMMMMMTAFSYCEWRKMSSSSWRDFLRIGAPIFGTSRARVLDLFLLSFEHGGKNFLGGRIPHAPWQTPISTNTASYETAEYDNLCIAWGSELIARLKSCQKN
jgi:hypothetical protein